jgi:hypothetical protein
VSACAGIGVLIAVIAKMLRIEIAKMRDRIGFFPFPFPNIAVYARFVYLGCVNRSFFFVKAKFMLLEDSKLLATVLHAFGNIAPAQPLGGIPAVDGLEKASFGDAAPAFSSIFAQVPHECLFPFAHAASGEGCKVRKCDYAQMRHPSTL